MEEHKYTLSNDAFRDALLLYALKKGWDIPDVFSLEVEICDQSDPNRRVVLHFGPPDSMEDALANCAFSTLSEATTTNE